MIKAIPIVLDTNILVSSLWSADGVPSKIVRLIPEGVIIPCYSDEILHEYGMVLARPAFNFSLEQVNELLRLYTKYGTLVSSTPSIISLYDETDRKFYDAARSGGAILITGNIRHFPKEPFIMSPANFYRYILGRPD